MVLWKPGPPKRHLHPLLLFSAGVVSALAGAGLAAGGVIALGVYDVGASTPHGALTAWTLHTAFIRSVAAHAGAEAPRFTSAQVMAGLRQYRQDCLQCHGAPGVGRERWVSGMTPTPPYLSGAAGHWTAGQLHWVIANGAKMTGMPAWKVSRSDDQIWNLVAFVEALPSMTADDYARMVSTDSSNQGRTP